MALAPADMQMTTKGTGDEHFPWLHTQERAISPDSMKPWQVYRSQRKEAKHGSPLSHQTQQTTNQMNTPPCTHGTHMQGGQEDSRGTERRKAKQAITPYNMQTDDA
mmetsp:Transcript_11198/g.32475  ORF Transcript_11198/g.32475 Transcript_11198/m.32475 type:complete len:106 (-) Transcript_11198:1033-1350(-)